MYSGRSYQQPQQQIVQAPKPRFANVNTGIQAGPVYNQGQIQNAQSLYSNFRPQGFAGEAYDQMAPLAAMNSYRNMLSGNAEQELASQQAQGAAGNRWGSLALQNSSIQNNQMMHRQNAALSLLRSMGIA